MLSELQTSEDNTNNDEDSDDYVSHNTAIECDV